MKEITEIYLNPDAFDDMWEALNRDGISSHSKEHAKKGIYNLILPGYPFVFIREES